MVQYFEGRAPSKSTSNISLEMKRSHFEDDFYVERALGILWDLLSIYQYYVGINCWYHSTTILLLELPSDLTNCKVTKKSLFKILFISQTTLILLVVASTKLARLQALRCFTQINNKILFEGYWTSVCEAPEQIQTSSFRTHERA